MREQYCDSKEIEQVLVLYNNSVDEYLDGIESVWLDYIKTWFEKKRKGSKWDTRQIFKNNC